MLVHFLFFWEYLHKYKKFKLVSDEEKEEIEELWANGDPNDEYERSGAAWLYDYSDWEVEEDTITILGPFVVDKIDEDVYNESIETVELKPRPPFVATTAWPFSG